jgi:nucleoside-diphosphate-sugar epimerase
MGSIAVTGAAGVLGQRLLPLLDASTRVVALDVREPERRTPQLEFHRVDLATADVKPLLEGVDVIVHLAAITDPILDDALMARVNVEGTRRLLEAASAVGVQRIVRVSTAAVYGAYSNNPVPLDEDAALRPNPGFTPAVHSAEVERLLGEWRDAHPGVSLTVLRAAPVCAPGHNQLAARLLAGRPPLRLRGEAPPIQVVHADDVASALALVVRESLTGVYNVSADGWVDAGTVAELLDGRPSVAVSPELAGRFIGWLWRSGVGDVPGSILPYLMYPWVLANDRLRAAGWEPVFSNEEAILATLPGDAVLRPSPAVIKAAAVAGAAMVTAAAAAGFALRRHRG